MIKLIKRTTDNKFLQSVETDTWVDNGKDAFEMTQKEFELVKTQLLNTYPADQLKEIINLHKIKPVSDEEKQEFLNSFKK